jgi:predicted 3-demethylubiquinone-9 3-methyltransferase (glyoxalase superfamily)
MSIPAALLRPPYMKKITPFLWFDTQAEEAANFYVSIFDNSRILNASRYSDAGWQITPTILSELMPGPDPGKSKRVMEAMLKMKKFDIAALKKAYDQA